MNMQCHGRLIIHFMWYSTVTVTQGKCSFVISWQHRDSGLVSWTKLLLPESLSLQQLHAHYVAGSILLACKLMKSSRLVTLLFWRSCERRCIPHLGGVGGRLRVGCSHGVQKLLIHSHCQQLAAWC